jgi:hypothetical protein
MNQSRAPLAKPSLNPGMNAEGDFRPVAVSSGSADQALFSLDIKRSLQLHWKLARAVALGFVALAILYVLAQVFWFKSWPTYVAVSTVYIQPTPSKVLPSEGGAPRWPFDSNTYETYIQQQMMNVSREDVLIGAVHKLNGFQGPGESDQAAAQRLVRGLEVNRFGEAYQFTISSRAGNAQAAADIANAVTAAYIESASRDERTGDTQRLAMLKEESDRIMAALAADHAEQDTLNKQLGVAAVGLTAPDHYDEDITQIRTELAKARIDHDIAEQKFASLDAGHGPSSTVIDAQADEMIATDAGLISMKQSLNSRRATLISQMANLTPANPQYKQDEAELVNINGTLEGMMKDLRAKAAARIQLQLRADLQRTGGVESELNGQLRQLVGSATSATPKLQRSGDLAADIARLQARYAAVDEQFHNVLLEDTAPAAAYQIMPAKPPLTRTKSGVLRNAVLISFSGLFFAVLAAIAAHRLDPRVYVASDVEHVLGFAPLALLPNFEEVSEGVTEEYMLRLASAIEHGRKQGDLKHCIFTGTGSGTGVSSVVSRVQGMLQAMGRPTVLVDASGALAPAPRANAMGAQAGLAALQRAGRPNALLQKMAEGTQTGEQALVLADTAPLLVSAETEYLARYVDCAIVVIESGVTTRTELRNTATMLQRLGVGAVGFVLNRIALAKADPAFRASIEAAEKHLQAQGTQPTRTAERTAPSSPETQLTAKEAPRPIAYSRRSMFEPEVAAAAAAVARFTPNAKRHPTLGPSEPAVCLASPAVAAPVAAAAKRFSLPLIAEVPADVSPHVPAGLKTECAKAAEPAVEDPTLQETPADVMSSASATAVEIPRQVPLEEPAVRMRTPASSPFAEAAKRFISNLPTGPAVSPARPISSPVFTNALPVGPAELPVVPSVARVSPPVIAGILEAVDEFEVAQEHSSAPPQLNQAPEVPWWLSETPHNADPVRTAVLWQPAKIWNAQPGADEAPAAMTTPVPNGYSAFLHSLPSDSALADRQQTLLESELNPQAANAAAPRYDDLEDASSVQTSRLSGLRNLLFVLGVKNTQAPGEPGDPQPFGMSNSPQCGARATYERNVGQAQENAEGNVGGASAGVSPGLVTAPPEFLPPKAIEEDKTDAINEGSPLRQDRLITADGTDILPSKRGQYKKL